MNMSDKKKMLEQLSERMQDLKDKCITKSIAESMGNGPKSNGKMQLFKEYANLRQDMERAILLYPDEKDSMNDKINKIDELRKVFKVDATKISCLDVIFTVVRLILLLIVFLCGGFIICFFAPISWILDPLLQRCGVPPSMQVEGLVCRYGFWTPLLAAAFIDVKVIDDNGNSGWKAGEGGFVVVNHTSNLDGFVIGPHLSPFMPKFIAKKVLFHIPILGWMAFLQGHILLNRKKRTKAVASMNHAVDNVIKRQRRALCIFPEGTRTDDGNLRLPFKKGVFHMQMQTGAPFIPVVVYGGYELWPRQRFFISPGQVSIRCLPAMHFNPKEVDREDVRIALQQKYIDTLYETSSPSSKSLSFYGFLKCIFTLAVALYTYKWFYLHFLMDILSYYQVSNYRIYTSVAIFQITISLYIVLFK